MEWQNRDGVEGPPPHPASAMVIVMRATRFFGNAPHYPRLDGAFVAPWGIRSAAKQQP
jgi:hypothetical protein